MHVCSVVFDSLRPHGVKPSRLLCPWDFPGKKTSELPFPPPRTLPTLLAVSGETRGPGSPDVGRVLFAAPGTIPSFTAQAGRQGQRQHQPGLTLRAKAL